jgi:hypothetical protein
MNLDAKITEDRQKTTYEIYLTLHSSRSFYHKKTLRSVMGEMLYAEPEAWRAVGITRATLAAYTEAGHRLISGIERAHLTDRNKMIDHIFERDQPLSFDELFDYWLKTDQTVIALRRENRSNTLEERILFNNEDAKYFQRLGIGFQYRPAIEGELTRRLADKSN